MSTAARLTAKTGPGTSGFRQFAALCRRTVRALAAVSGVSLLSGAAAIPAYAAPPEPLIKLDFEQLHQGRLPPGSTIHTQFAAPDVVPGVDGSAWRTDGFSSYLHSALRLSAQRGFTLSLWVALESYPSDREVPVGELRPSSLAQQALDDAGFNLYIDAFGRWGFRVGTTNGSWHAAAPRPFPLWRWVEIMVVVDPVAGHVRLYEDRQLIASRAGTPGATLRLAAVPFTLAAPPVPAMILDFQVNRINGAYDLIAVIPEALTAEQVARQPRHVPAAAPSDSLKVPASRFAGDWLRPRVHAMPPANWANEPHGLVRKGDRWHLFYQRTPNGPFKTLMHWGHMSSPDLVNWTHWPDALRPELQTETFGFDMKGIWSGHVLVEDDKAFAFYTSVNHGDRLAAANPGIAMAVSEDENLSTWRKAGPILNSRGLRDFRDPFVWRSGNKLHMIVGAALESGGGLAYYTLEPGPGQPSWQLQPRFTDPGYRVLDPGSQIWEMPVFQSLGDDVWVLVVNPIGGRFSKYGDAATRAMYWTGRWVDGLFKPFFREPKLLDLVPGHLAPTVARAADGQLRAIGIVDERRTPEAQRKAGWAHTFSIPRAWSLMPDQRTLGQSPAPEFKALRGDRRVALEDVGVTGTPATLVEGLSAYELVLDAREWPEGAGALRVDVLSTKDGREKTGLIFDRVSGRVQVDFTASTLSGDREGPALLQGPYDAQAFGHMSRVRVFVDGSVVEVFINDAAAYSIRSYPSRPDSTAVRVSVAGNSDLTARVQLWPLRPTSP